MSQTTWTEAEPSTPAAGRERVVSTHIQASSPHYATTRRHSLYGTEDRIILDPGSRVWKVGFSGEGRPRDVFVVGDNGSGLWELSSAQDPAEREEDERQLEAKMQHHLRSVFHDSLLSDPKSRKVIIVENPLLPMSIKETLAKILFENLQVPSISLAPSHLLSLLGVGLMSGLVLDTGHLESVVLPVIASRPLYPYLKTTPLAGSRLNSHIRTLLVLFGTYIPPPTTLSGAASISTGPRPERIPEEILTDAVIEEIKTRCFFVGQPPNLPRPPTNAMPAPPPSEDAMSVDVPASEPPSESGISRMSDADLAREHLSETRTSGADRQRLDAHSQWIYTMFRQQSNATDVKLKVNPPAHQQTGTGRGTIIIPGWIRERAAECLFGGDVDESSVAEVILDSLLKVPRDLRKGLISSILIVGGTAMLPGFIPRLHLELVKALTPREEQSRPSRRRSYDPYAPLQPLLPYVAIINHPSPPPSSRPTTGRAPAYAPAALPWVGGSLAGALKTGGEEILRERWDQAHNDDTDIDMDPSTHSMGWTTRSVLPDWSRTPLPAGAPSASAVPSTPMIAVT